MMPEDRLVIGREEVLRPPPWPLALDHRIDGDVADPELLHGCFPDFMKQRIGRAAAVQVGGGADRIFASPISCASPALRGRCAPRIQYSRRRTGAGLRASTPARDWRARRENAGRGKRTAWCPRIPTMH